MDVDEWEAEYHRGQAETDPIKKSRITNFLKEYWGVQRGGNFGNQYMKMPIPQNGEKPNSEEIAKVVGTQVKHLNRILKLNDPYS